MSGCHGTSCRLGLNHDKCILSMVQKCTNKVILVKSQDMPDLAKDTYYQKRQKDSLVILIKGQQIKNKEECYAVGMQ